MTTIGNTRDVTLAITHWALYLGGPSHPIMIQSLSAKLCPASSLLIRVGQIQYKPTLYTKLKQTFHTNNKTLNTKE
jgi:hypothetical protein